MKSIIQSLSLFMVIALAACGSPAKQPVTNPPGSGTGSGATEDLSRPACIAEYAPVCGADGKTYGNSCEASVAKVAIKSEGACPATKAQ